MTNKKEPTANKKTIQALEISSRPESFYRAGRRWTRTASVVPVSEFSKDEIKALKAEPNLAVVEKTIEASE